jgi:hypothetical protein
MNNDNEPTIEQLKQSLDIITIAETYGELVKSGSNYKYKDDKSIIINSDKQIFSNFNGDITGGSVLDLIMYMEKINLADGIKRLKELNGQETYHINPDLQIKRKEEATKKKTIDFKKLGYIGSLELKIPVLKQPIEYRKQSDNSLIHLHLCEEYSKLFETDKIQTEDKIKLDYLFKHILGWSEFFKCPSIILKDDTGRIVDIIAYRPTKPDNFDNWTNPKYIYKNSHNRGENFLYPFRKEVETILKRQIKDKYLIVGEGIKNGLNALLYSVPYIPLESSSNKLDDNLKNYILSYYNKGYNIICMFDGDKAGKKAYENFIQQIGQNFNNFLDFNSNLDFVDYLQSEDN